MPKGAGEPETLAPDDAFALLGNETRMEILQALGEADDPLPFSELRDRVGTRDSGQFNYHLGKLDGHFVEETEGGYALRQNGRRVIEAVLSGAVTERPVLERTPVDLSCNRCGATSIEIDYREERLGVYCSECSGLYDTERAKNPPNREKLGYQGAVFVPPAALHDRTPEELVLAALTWNGAEKMMATSGVCPRCSAPVADSLTVCENHDATDGLCERCGTRYAVTVQNWCVNCPYDRSGIMGIYLLANPDLRAFLLDHDVDLFSPTSGRIMRVVLEYEEEILETDPFEGRFTFTIDDETLTLTVDDELSVTEARRGTTGDAV